MKSICKANFKALYDYIKVKQKVKDNFNHLIKADGSQRVKLQIIYRPSRYVLESIMYKRLYMFVHFLLMINKMNY